MGYLDPDPPGCPDRHAAVIRIEPEPGELDPEIYLLSEDFVWGPILLVEQSDRCPPAAGPST